MKRKGDIIRRLGHVIVKDDSIDIRKSIGYIFKGSRHKLFLTAV